MAPPTGPPGPVLHTVGLKLLRVAHAQIPLSVDGVPYAEGRGGEKGEARENAARNCYMILRPQ